jgi:hypothetical protein
MPFTPNPATRPYNLSLERCLKLEGVIALQFARVYFGIACCDVSHDFALLLRILPTPYLHHNLN